MSLLMGIDVGTSSLKTVVTDESGNLLAKASKGYSIDIPFQGYAEQDPDLWWEACVYTIRECFGKRNFRPEDITAVSFSGQMHSMVILDKDLKVIRPSILHCDQRSVKQAESIRQLLGEDYITKNVLNPIYSGFSTVSLVWLRENEPDCYNRIYKVLSPKDYIRFKLTGVVSTECSDASGTLAFDIMKGTWNHDLLAKLSLHQEIFPDCFESKDVVGRISEEAAGSTGLSTGTQVVSGGSDQLMQSIGNGAINPLDSTVTIGTSGQVFLNVQEPVLNPRLNTHLFSGITKDSRYALGATLSAGVCLKWYRELIGLNETDYGIFDDMVAGISPGSEGLVFLPYLSGERTPHLNAFARGSFFGITPNKSKWHFGRAIMEGVVYSLLDCMNVFYELGLNPKRIIASGGGRKSRVWLGMQADIFNREICINSVDEQAAVGAAILAGYGAGVYGSLEEGCAKVVKFTDEPIKPNLENVLKYQKYFSIYKELYRRNEQVFSMLREAEGI